MRNIMITKISFSPYFVVKNFFINSLTSFLPSLSLSLSYKSYIARGIITHIKIYPASMTLSYNDILPIINATIPTMNAVNISIPSPFPLANLLRKKRVKTGPTV